MDPDEAVVVKVVSGESEAEVVCGLLRSACIACAYRDTTAIDSSLEEFTAAGPREILVHESDAEQRGLCSRTARAESGPRAGKVPR